MNGIKNNLIKTNDKLKLNIIFNYYLIIKYFMSKPKLLISVIILNSKEDKILLIQKKHKDYYQFFDKRLEFGEEFLSSAINIVENNLNYNIEINKERFKYICCFNATNKEINSHFVIINFLLILTLEENKFFENFQYFNYNIYNIKWSSFNDLKNIKLFYGIEIFIKKFKLENFAQIKNILSN